MPRPFSNYLRARDYYPSEVVRRVAAQHNWTIECVKDPDYGYFDNTGTWHPTLVTTSVRINTVSARVAGTHKVVRRLIWKGVVETACDVWMAGEPDADGR